MRLFLLLSLLALLSCHPKELSPLDEGYPVNLDGTRITTYNTQKLGGSFDIQFNGHDWNHYPFCSFSLTKQVKKDTILALNFAMIVNLFKPSSCIKELLYLYTPYRKGFFYIPVTEIPLNTDYQYFYGYDCDYLTQGFELAQSPRSWIEITELDTTKPLVSGKFFLSLKKIAPIIQEGPIYPEWVEIQGSFSRTYFGS